MPISPAVADPTVRDLVRVYYEAERQLLAKIARRLGDGIERDGWEARKAAQLRIMRRELEAEMARAAGTMTPLIEQALADAYAAGSIAAGADLARAGGNVAPGLLRVTGDAAIRDLIGQTTGRLVATHQLAIGQALNAYQRAVAAGSSQVLTGALTRREAAQQVLDRLAATGVTGYTDRAGRAWSLASYVEASMRGTVAKAAINGHVERLVAAGQDLVIINDSPQECPTCRPWEGKVVSLTGATPGYPTLRQAQSDGLYHPGCTHSQSLYIEGVTRPRGQANPDGYEDKQKLRYYERQVRASRRLEAAALDPVALQKAQARTRAYQAKIRDHVATTEAKRQPHRERLGVAR